MQRGRGDNMRKIENKEERTVLETTKNLKVKLKAYASVNNRLLREVTNEALEAYLREKGVIK